MKRNEYLQSDVFGPEQNFNADQSIQTSLEAETKQPECQMSQSQLSDSIDTTVRVVYPLLFFVFNIVYWRIWNPSNL